LNAAAPAGEPLQNDHFEFVGVNPEAIDPKVQATVRQVVKDVRREVPLSRGDDRHVAPRTSRES
jgi:hypothetical protein